MSGPGNPYSNAVAAGLAVQRQNNGFVGAGVATRALLKAIPDASVTVGQQYKVATFDGYFEATTSAATDDGATSVTSNDGGIYWKRVNVPSAKAATQLTWWVDKTGGTTSDDEYDGSAQTWTGAGTFVGPVQHRDEIFRRLGPGWVLLNLTIHEQGTTFTTEKQIPLFGIYSEAATMSIDPANSTGLASDANDGLTDATPVLTWPKLQELKGLMLQNTFTVRCLSNAGAVRLKFIGSAVSSSTTTLSSVALRGIATVVDTGSLNNNVFINASTNTQSQVTDLSSKLGSYIDSPIAYKTGSVTAGTPDAFILRSEGSNVYTTGGDTGATAGTLTYNILSLPTISSLQIVAPYVNVTLNNFSMSGVATPVANIRALTLTLQNFVAIFTGGFTFQPTARLTLATVY
ncbi:MAG TPA: hypothetical protein VMT89_09390, partial [Candidatus Acidoferrales bacterium]|nr:hypothetical protein [Candidatus Acidoferrales bacterium]